MTGKKIMTSKMKVVKRMGAPERSNRTSLIARGKPWSIEMDDWLRKEAESRSSPSKQVTIADVVREGLEWYRTAKENAKEDIVKTKFE